MGRVTTDRGRKGSSSQGGLENISVQANIELEVELSLLYLYETYPAHDLMQAGEG